MTQTTAARTRASLDERAQRLAPQLKALADEARLTITLLLSERPHSVRELSEATGLSSSLVSHHLAILREQGLARSTPRGRANIYELCCAEFAEPMRMLAGLARTDEANCSDCAAD